MMATTIDNYQDIIDSRDIIARIDELESMLEDSNIDEDETRELEALHKLADEASGCAADWQYGEALIRDSHFRDYAQELAEDIGAISREQSWPNYCIDWNQAARDLQMDYTAVEFDGVTYWIR